MGEIVGKVVTAEGQHGHRVKSQFAHCTGLGRCGFRCHDGSEEHSVFPVVGFGHERHSGAPTAAKQDGRDRHSRRIFPLRSDRGALGGGHGEAGVGMSSRGLSFWSPRVASPVGRTGRWGVGHVLPPHIAIGGQGGVGVDGIAPQGMHRVGVGVKPGSGGHAKESRLGIDGVETTIIAKFHPADVVADGLGLPARDRGNEHGQVGLTACRRERRGDVLGLILRVGQFEDEHVLCEPAIVAGHHRSDPQGEAFFTEQSIAAISRTKRPDVASLREVDDVFIIRIARPRGVSLAGLKGCAH